MAEIANYINNKKNGFHKLYFNGRLTQIVYYINDQKQGICLTYFWGETIESIINYVDGKKNGICKSYHYPGNELSCTVLYYSNDIQISYKEYKKLNFENNKNIDYSHEDEYEMIKYDINTYLKEINYENINFNKINNKILDDININYEDEDYNEYYDKKNPNNQDKYNPTTCIFRIEINDTKYKYIEKYNDDYNITDDYIESNLFNSKNDIDNINNNLDDDDIDNNIDDDDIDNNLDDDKDNNKDDNKDNHIDIEIKIINNNNLKEINIEKILNNLLEIDNIKILLNNLHQQTKTFYFLTKDNNIIEDYDITTHFDNIKNNNIDIIKNIDNIKNDIIDIKNDNIDNIKKDIIDIKKDNIDNIKKDIIDIKKIL